MAPSSTPVAAEAAQPSPAGRLEQTFARLRRDGRAALVMYVTAGDPGLEATPAILRALVRGGVDIIELGYPFADPALDGPVIRQANHRALAAGGSLPATLEIARDLRRADAVTPIVLMGYYEPIRALGSTAFARAAADAGVDAVLVPDLPPALARRGLRPALAAHGLAQIPFCAPGLELGEVLADGPGQGGFLYCAPTRGRTGGRIASMATVRREVARCRTMTQLPVAVGFGVKTPATAAAVGAVADAVIVATALISEIDELGRGGAAGSSGFQAKLVRYVAGFRNAMDAARREDV